jgi:putative ABC transport system permease protein
MLGDIRYAFRTLRKTPRFTIMAVLVLALGIGANSAMFTVVYSVLLRPLPYTDPSRIAVIQAGLERGGGPMPVTPGDFHDFRDRNRSFEQIAAATLWSPTLTGIDRAEQLDGMPASASLFRILGVQAAYGRLFTVEDGRPDAPEVVVLSYDLFQRRFGGDPAIVGRTITLDGKGRTVVGITPRGFYFPPFWAVKADILPQWNSAPKAKGAAARDICGCSDD